MKILHLTKFLPTYHGGLEHVTRQMAEAGVRLGAEVTVAGVDPDRLQPSPSNPSSKPWREIGLRSFGSIGPVALAPGFLNLRDEFWKSDVVHIHLPNPLAEIAVLFYLIQARGQPSPAIIPVAHADNLRWPWVAAIWNPLFLKPLLKHANAIMVGSKHFASQSHIYQKHSDRLAVLPFAIPEPVLPTSAKAPDWRQLGKRMLGIGRFVPYKGFDVLIDALQELKDQDWSLILIGSGPERQHLEALIAKHGLEQRIQLVSHVSEENKSAWLNSCDFLVMPSRSPQEAFGIAIAEAFACSKPVVTTTLQTGVAFLARNGACGAVATPGSVSELRDAISTLLDDQTDLKGIGTRNRQFWEQELTETKFTARYRELLGKMNLRK